jgi:asparagine synthase (glutamine-hydrolysing)
MKLQLGLLHTDGRPASPDDLAMLLGEFANTPADTSGEACDGELLMGYRGDRITFEEDSEAQPLEDGPYILTWDGRLDNREDFKVCFPLTDVSKIPDPAIVLKAYQMFGESILEKLIGEFALTLWCQQSRSLLFVRSTCGARPLYYVLNGKTLLWSSDFAHLVRISGADLAINEAYILEYLVSQPSTKHTPLSRIDVVPPNTVVRFQDGRAKVTRRLWNPEHVAPLHYRTDQEYEEHCREKLTEAVRVRLRANSPVFSELSGGFDSSSVVLIADQILKSRKQPIENLRTVSGVFEQSKTCDERPFIHAVEEKRGLKTLAVHEDEQQATLGLRNLKFTGLPNPLHFLPGRYSRFSQLMQEHRAHILFTGIGGDHLFWSAPDGAPLMADEVRAGNLFRAHRHCLAWSRHDGLPYLQLARRAMLLAGGDVYQRPPKPDWLGLKHKLAISREEIDFPGRTATSGIPSRRVKLFAMDLLFRSTGSGQFNEYQQLYVSHPYTHRPLLEFCLAVPLSQFLRDGQTRSLLRRALAELLPQKILKRVSKGLAEELIVRTLHREWGIVGDLRQWQVCERGFVQALQLSAAFNRARLGFQDSSGLLMRICSLERWLRSLEYIRSDPVQKYVRQSSLIVQQSLSRAS